MYRLALRPLFVCSLHAADDRLEAIRAVLVPMRSAPITKARGATPALTDVKHQLRDWLELRLSALQWKDGRWEPDPEVLQEQLNDELNRAGLLCPRDSRCRETPLGYLERVALEIQSGFLVAHTTAGIQICGTDDSAYIYEWTDNHWRRIWESEQTDYDEKKYLPQRIVEVKISETDWQPESDHSGHLIVTTGVLPWCTSVWQPVYYRVWQTKSTNSKPLLLLDESEQAEIASPIHARANQNDVSIEFQVFADDAMRVSELRHYVLEMESSSVPTLSR